MTSRYLKNPKLSIRGTIWVPSDSAYPNKTYESRSRASALTLDGMATCEILLPDCNKIISREPIHAELHFVDKVKLSAGREPILLFSGSKHILSFIKEISTG